MQLNPIELLRMNEWYTTQIYNKNHNLLSGSFNRMKNVNAFVITNLNSFTSKNLMRHLLYPKYNQQKYFSQQFILFCSLFFKIHCANWNITKTSWYTMNFHIHFWNEINRVLIIVWNAYFYDWFVIIFMNLLYHWVFYFHESLLWLGFSFFNEMHPSNFQTKLESDIKELFSLMNVRGGKFMG